MAIPIGINADAHFLGDTGTFLKFAQGCGAVTLLNDHEWKLLPELRANNSQQILISRYVYDTGGAEGAWRDVLYDNKPQTAQRMADVLSAGYRPELGVWVNFGNEPARGPSDEIAKDATKADTIKRDVEFYCETAQILVRNRVKAVLLNIQAPELTPITLPLYRPLFEMMNTYPEYLALGIHFYFPFILRLGIGTGDWAKLIQWGAYPKEARPTPAEMMGNAANANIGRDAWLRYTLDSWGYTKIRLFATEFGFDHLKNVPPQAALDAALNLKDELVDGIDNVVKVFARYYPDQWGEVSAAHEVTWVGDTTYCEALCFYNWSIEGKWKRYSAHSHDIFRLAILSYNVGITNARPLPSPIVISAPTPTPAPAPVPVPVTTPAPEPPKPSWRVSFDAAELAWIDRETKRDTSGILAKLVALL